jgi:hypothetical protein
MIQTIAQIRKTGIIPEEIKGIIFLFQGFI